MTSLRISDIPMEKSDLASAADKVAKDAKSRECLTTYRFINIHNLTYAARDATYARLLQSTGVNFPDGWPLVVANNAISSGGYRQVRGPALMGEVLDQGRQLGLRHFILGGSEETLKQLSREIIARYPGVDIVGAWSPPFRSLTADETKAQDEMIARANPDIVWVGLGAPKQEVEAHRITTSIGVSSAAVGAAFDFLAGTRREAPKFLQVMGLEWLFRLAHEPRRLWRRYLFAGLRFGVMFVREIGWIAAGPKRRAPSVVSANGGGSAAQRQPASRRSPEGIARDVEAAESSEA
jgi:N-acetylglucosaminyldiphosphoundecaprenol N-acetyl-beta-D-mannosaminyltransferase